MNVTIISVKNNDEAPSGIRLEKLLSKSPFRYINIFLFFKIRSFVKKENITHLIIEHPYYGWLGWLLKHFWGIKLIVHSHNIEATRFKSLGKIWWPILWLYEKWTYNKANAVFFITDKDNEYAIKHFKLPNSKCFLITYGTEKQHIPTLQQRTYAKSKIRLAHNISEADIILLFNGMLDYAPNLQALDFILQKINPLLLQREMLSYTFIICGKNLPEDYGSLKKHKNIVYAGFVEDIDDYFLGADYFINPIKDGGGIKTKLVEALAANLSAVSSSNGAIGIPKKVAVNKLTIADLDNPNSFTDAINENVKRTETPKQFYDHFYWGNIAEKAVNIIKAL